jgi:hypothetical protein
MRNDEDAGAAMRLYRSLGDELGVSVYDPLPFFLDGQTDLLFYDTMHMSRLGHAVFARGLADQLEAGPLGSPPPSPPTARAVGPAPDLDATAEGAAP